MSQPPPKTGRETIYPIAQQYLVKKLKERYEKGLETYGTPLQTFNGRDCLEDLMEELLDGLMYTIQAMLEDKANGNKCDTCSYRHKEGMQEVPITRQRVQGRKQVPRKSRSKL